MEISIHEVTSIRTESYELPLPSARSVKSLYITDAKGNEFGIDLFANSAAELEIKDGAELESA